MEQPLKSDPRVALDPLNSVIGGLKRAVQGQRGLNFNKIQTNEASGLPRKVMRRGPEILRPSIPSIETQPPIPNSQSLSQYREQSQEGRREIRAASTHFYTAS